ncbi:glycosyltransferase family 4 protein [Anaerocolumna chitinilytica]|uniref:Putative glycosyltransferase EpsD n=1 Tax=Anaerocolumna chitinilytica TaxID=1727145 RepID=A0A7I8DRB5_9FIRM|nr:glycosyltransferase family 4 protein [Anaerocolumna chitinilytica]BCK00823.1 putative glycosyltransferase EpsD [Anaerocolumna chitinilytica]
MKKVLMTASVASMIDLFNKNNIDILQNDLGYKVDVACNFHHGSITSQERVNEYRNELETIGVKTYHVPIPRSLMGIKDIIKSYHLLKEISQVNKYDIIHCHSPIGGVIARLACRKQRKNGTKIVYTAHGFHFFNGSSIKSWMLYYPIERFCARYTDCLITINKEDYLRACKFRAKKVEYVPGIGIKTNEYHSKFDRVTKRQEFGIEIDDFLLINVGQLSKRKNQEILIKALANISNLRVKLLICGLGELEKYYKELIEKLHLENRVILTGYRGDVKNLLQISDCFLFPSLQEGLPVALMEAMAVGLPVVCSSIRGNIDLIDENGGYLIKTFDIKEYTEAIIKITEDENLCKKMGKYNENIIKEFDMNIVNNKMKYIYNDLAK